MIYDPKRHHRKSTRLKGWDYSRPGAYFVTVCVERRKCLFGEIHDSKMCLEPGGKMIWRWWYELNKKFAQVDTDEAIVMPNHFHGIIFIHDDLCVGAALRGRPKDSEYNTGHPHRGAPTSLYDVMEWFKTMTTNAYINGVKTHDWPRFPGQLWQRNYHDHIIRNEKELNDIREYIINNPLKWELDQDNPDNWKGDSTTDA